MEDMNLDTMILVITYATYRLTNYPCPLDMYLLRSSMNNTRYRTRIRLIMKAIRVTAGSDVHRTGSKCK